jgi:hypothetical protein
MVHIEKQPWKFSEKKKDADKKSYLNLKFLNVLCTKNLYWILLCRKKSYNAFLRPRKPRKAKHTGLIFDSYTPPNCPSKNIKV